MQAEPFDVGTAAEAAAAEWGAVVAAWSPVWTPRGFAPPVEWLLNEARHPSSDQRVHRWVLRDGGDAVGALEMEWFEAPDNRDRAFLTVQLPDERASDEALATLFAAAARVAEPAGRTLLNVYAPTESAVGRWVRARGGTLGSVEQVNVTRFDALDRDDVAALAAATPAGYELLRVDSPVPDDAMAPLIRLAGAMNDAPRDDLTMEDWVFTPERMRAYEDALAARGHALWTVVARHLETGVFAGFNQLAVYPDWPEVIENEDTGVSDEHRGHGLGLWLKAVNLLRALDHPGAGCVLTWNAASNDHMLRVNRRLGFECEHTWDSLELATAAAR